MVVVFQKDTEKYCKKTQKAIAQKTEMHVVAKK